MSNIMRPKTQHGSRMIALYILSGIKKRIRGFSSFVYGRHQSTLKSNDKDTILVVTHFRKNTVGYEDYTHRLKSLEKLYKNVRVVCNDEQSCHELKQFADNVTFVPLRFKGLLKFIEYTFIIKRKFLTDRCDILLLHTWLSVLSFFFIGYDNYLYWNIHPSQLYGRKKIRTVRDVFVNIKNLFLKKLTYTGAARCRKVMPVGEELARDLIEHNINKEKVDLIYQGVKDEFYTKARDCDHGTINLIYAGSVVSIRGIDLIIEGFCEFLNTNHADMKLVLIGAGDNAYCKYSELVKQKGIERNVEILKRMPGNKIPEYLKKADIGISFLEPNIYYSYNPPTKIFEFMAAGIPVIANSIRTNTRYIQDEYNGYICQYNAESFAKKLSQIWDNRDKIKQMKMNAKHEGQKYRWAKLEKEFLKQFSF